MHSNRLYLFIFENIADVISLFFSLLEFIDIFPTVCWPCFFPLGRVSAKENGATLCAILHASFMALKQEDTTLNLVALVSFNSPSIRSTGFDGFITTYADTSKKKSNLVLRIFPPDQKPAWIGSMNQVVPAGVFEEDLVSGMQSSSFPVQTESSKFCSYNDSSCIAWLQSPNLFADAQKFVRLAKKVTPEKRGQVFTEANRIISIAKALSFPQYMVT